MIPDNVSLLGCQVFGSKEKFEIWLTTSSPALGNVKPKELLTDEYRMEMVIRELVFINEGILV